MARYSKAYSSPAQLVSLLQSRGLLIENATRTENYLRHIGYYRFSAYLYPLLTTPKENHVFKPGATFNQALDMYRFDRHLRAFPQHLFRPVSTSLDVGRDTSLRRFDQDIRQHQEQSNPKEDSPRVLVRHTCIQFLDDHHYGCPK